MAITNSINVDIDAWGRMLKVNFSEQDCTLFGLKAWANEMVFQSYGECCERLSMCDTWVYCVPTMCDYFNDGDRFSAYVMRSYSAVYAVAVCDKDTGVCEIYNFGDNSGYAGFVISKNHVNKLVNEIYDDGYTVKKYDLYHNSCMAKREYDLISGDDYKEFLSDKFICEYARLWGKVCG